jgi:hypothetical protein
MRSQVIYALEAEEIQEIKETGYSETCCSQERRRNPAQGCTVFVMTAPLSDGSHPMPRAKDVKRASAHVHGIAGGRPLTGLLGTLKEAGEKQVPRASSQLMKSQLMKSGVSTTLRRSFAPAFPRLVGF